MNKTIVFSYVCISGLFLQVSAYGLFLVYKSELTLGHFLLDTRIKWATFRKCKYRQLHVSRCPASLEVIRTKANNAGVRIFNILLIFYVDFNNNILCE